MFDIETENVLRELEKTRENFWNVAPSTANFLNMLVKLRNAKNVLELGTSNGYSAIWLAKALKETQGKLTTIEFWEKRLLPAKENFKICKVDDIIATRLGSAKDILVDLINEGQTFDFVFIDANKSEYVKYFELADKMLVKNGVIVADDILTHTEKVQPFLDAIQGHASYQSELLKFDDGLLFAIKS